MHLRSKWLSPRDSFRPKNAVEAKLFANDSPREAHETATQTPLRGWLFRLAYSMHLACETIIFAPVATRDQRGEEANQAA